jgi:ribosomal protein S18 acetylase RimI-like enzyme
MSTEVAPIQSSQSEGLSFEVRECDGDRVCTPGSPTSPASPASELEYDDDSCRSMLMRSDSSSAWDDPEPSPAPAPEAVKDANINRVQLGDNPETIALLHFLTSQGIDTTKLVTEHLMKYGSRVRIAQTDEGAIIGCLIFDNETDQSELQGMTADEVKKRVGPFIYMQLLVVAPEHAIDAEKRWKERLLASFLECVTKNGKIAIIRADADNIKDIELYRSCGFFTMEDMDIPSYSSVKGNMEILAYTPMGLEGTSQLFKKFYDMGARF